MTDDLTLKEMQSGHRERIKEKFLKTDGEIFEDYELLELLLTYAIPRKDVKPLAKMLLAKFGSLGNVLSANTSDLLDVKGIKEHSATLIKLTACMTKSILKKEVMNKTLLTSCKDVENYCHALLGRETKEYVYAIALDATNQVIEVILIQKGTVSESPVYPREVVEKLIKCGAVSFILVHNHPSGDTKPSKADIILTESLFDATHNLGIRMQDHYIVSARGINSFRLMGLMDKIENY